jgi:hypothetical protein
VILKSSFFAVAAFISPSRVIIGINMHQETTRPPPHGPLGVESRLSKIFCSLPNILWGGGLFKKIGELQ